MYKRQVPADTPGITVGKKEWNLGQRASDTRGLTFEEVKIPAKYLLGKEGDGFRIAMSAFDHTRPPVASGAVGLAQRAMDEAIKYAKERKTFGLPIAAYQSISFMIADMAMQIEAGRHLVRLAAWAIDNGKRNTKFAAMAKAFCADMAMKVDPTYAAICRKFMADPAYGPTIPYKMAAADVVLIPVDAQIVVPDLRWLVGGLLLNLYLLICWRRAVRDLREATRPAVNEFQGGRAPPVAPLSS